MRSGRLTGGGTGPTLSPLRSSRSIQPGGQMNQAAQCSRSPLQGTHLIALQNIDSVNTHDNTTILDSRDQQPLFDRISDVVDNRRHHHASKYTKFQLHKAQLPSVKSFTDTHKLLYHLETALPPNTSPLRSNTATTEETTETISLPLTSDRRRAGENQVASLVLSEVFCVPTLSL